MKNINWAVLGTGVIANEMAVALKRMEKISMQLAIEPMKKRSLLLKNMASAKSMQIIMKCLPILTLM